MALAMALRFFFFHISKILFAAVEINFFFFDTILLSYMNLSGSLTFIVSVMIHPFFFQDHIFL